MYALNVRLILQNNQMVFVTFQTLIVNKQTLSVVSLAKMDTTTNWAFALSCLQTAW